MHLNIIMHAELIEIYVYADDVVRPIGIKPCMLVTLWNKSYSFPNLTVHPLFTSSIHTTWRRS